MITFSTITETLDNLISISNTSPNERLPKEEQIRCHLYSLLKGALNPLCAERRYGLINDYPKIECDIWGKDRTGVESWIEIKTAWYSSDLNNKLPLQLKTWKYDIAKLSTVDPSSNRYFVLYAFLNFNTKAYETTNPPKIVSVLNDLCPFAPLIHESKPFTWPHAPNVSHVAAWVWYWPPHTLIH